MSDKYLGFHSKRWKMKKTGFLTAVTIIIALELTNFGYAPDIPKYENRVHKYNSKLVLPFCDIHKWV